MTTPFRVPRTFLRLWEHLLDGCDPAEHGRDSFGPRRCVQERTTGLLGELVDPEDLTMLEPGPMYQGEPMELVTFSYTGDAGLQYGWIVLAPELDLDDHLCVSYRPEEDLVWLGDDTRQALENLLVGKLVGHETEHERLHRRAADHGVAASAGEGEPAPVDRPQWAHLCEALDLRPETRAPEGIWKARWDRPVGPAVVPPGWRYEPADDGVVGVLAEVEAFAPEPFVIDPDWYGEESAEHAERVLRDGYPATALSIVKATYVGEPGVVETMRAAYRALGRDYHAERADAWLANWAEQR